MALLLGAQVDYKETNQTAYQETNELDLSTQFNDESIKDTLISNYITDIMNRDEDIQEVTRNFENNVKSEAESVQRNDLNLNGCIDMTEMELAQINELVQSVQQGFEMLYDDVKTLKRASSFDSATTQQGDITTDSAQTLAMQTDQITDVAQKSGQGAVQESAQKQTFVHKYASGGGLREAYYASRRAGSSMVKSIGKFLTKVVASTPKQESHVEHFMNLYYKSRKESFLPLFTKASVQVGVEKLNQHSDQKTNIQKFDFKTNIQTQDIYKKIESVYNKCNEVINKIKEDQNVINDSVARATSIQENKLTITNQSDICALKMNKAKLTQSNKLTQSVELKNIIKSITALSSDHESKAIMSDMFGLTASSTASQGAAMTSTQQSKIEQSVAQSASQSTSQTSEMSLPFGDMSGIIAIIIVIAVIGVIGSLFGFSGGGLDPFFDEIIPKNSPMSNDLASNFPAKPLTGGFYF